MGKFLDKAGLQRFANALIHKINRPYAGRVMVVCGDSFTYGTGAGGNDNRYSTRLARTLQMTEANYGQGGYGFCAATGTFLSELETAIADTNLNKEKVAIVLCMGGVNDLRHITDQGITYDAWVNAINAFCDRAHEAFPKARICLALGNLPSNHAPSTASGSPGGTQILPRWYQWIATAERSVPYNKSYPVEIIRNVGNSISGDISYYHTDYLHPNAIGHGRIAAHLARGLIDMGDDVNYTAEFIPMANTNYTISSGDHFYLWRENAYAGWNETIFNLKTSISTNTVVASLTTNNTPAYNAYAPIYRGNKVVGTIAVTTSGSIRLIPTESITGDVYIPRVRWLVGTVV